MVNVCICCCARCRVGALDRGAAIYCTMNRLGKGGGGGRGTSKKPVEAGRDREGPERGCVVDKQTKV